MVPTTITRITANITAYSAISWASSPTQAFQRTLTIFHLPWGTRERLAIQEGCGTAGKTLTRSRAKWLAFTPKCTADCALLLRACQASHAPKSPSIGLFGQQDHKNRARFLSEESKSRLWLNPRRDKPIIRAVQRRHNGRNPQSHRLPPFPSGEALLHCHFRHRR